MYASLGYGAIQVLATIPTLFLIDTKGRRTLCLIVSSSLENKHGHPKTNLYSMQTFPLMCIFLLAAGLSLLTPDTASRGEQIGPVAL